MPVASTTIANRRWALHGLGAGFWLASCLLTSGGHAQTAAPTAVEAPRELTRARVIELLRGAPESRVFEARLGVSRAAVSAADVASLENPQISALGGVRLNPDGTRPFAGNAALSWPLELGGKRAARVGVAEAEQRYVHAESDAQRQQLLLRALIEHAAALRATAELTIAEARLENAKRVLASAERRRAAGSVPPLDVALASLQRGRDAALAEVARGERDAALVRLQTLLGLPEATRLTVSGPLVPELEPPPLAALLQRLGERAPVKAAEAQVRAAKARAEREKSLAAPNLALLAQYERDDSANIALVGISLPLPVLSKNQLAKATAIAEISAAEAQLGAARAGVGGELRALYARYEATLRARAALAPTAAAARDSMALAARSYELGEGDLASVLLVHREALEAERALLETEHAHAVARLELLITVGRLPR